MDVEKAKAFWPPTCHGRWMSEEFEPGLVSVIIPTWNRAHFIVEAMDSVWAQTYRPIEMLVVDDGSTDDTREVVRQWRRHHRGDRRFRLRYFRQENRGAPAARNLGLIESRGEFIQFLDSDDVLHCKKLRRQVARFTTDETADFVYSGHALFIASPDQDAEVYPVRRVVGEFADCVPHAFPWNVESGLYARHTCRRVRPWDETLKCWQDLVYHLRVALTGPQVRFVPGALSFAREHAGGRIADLGRGVVGIQFQFDALRLMEHYVAAVAGSDRDYASAMARGYYWPVQAMHEAGSQNGDRDGVVAWVAQAFWFFMAASIVVCSVFVVAFRREVDTAFSRPGHGFQMAAISSTARWCCGESRKAGSSAH